MPVDPLGIPTQMLHASQFGMVFWPVVAAGVLFSVYAARRLWRRRA